jgi:hypothetical protein
MTTPEGEMEAKLAMEAATPEAAAAAKKTAKSEQGRRS